MLIDPGLTAYLKRVHLFEVRSRAGNAALASWPTDVNKVAPERRGPMGSSAGAPQLQLRTF